MGDISKRTLKSNYTRWGHDDWDNLNPGWWSIDLHTQNGRDDLFEYRRLRVTQKMADNLEAVDN
jgi:hypothetical protein